MTKEELLFALYESTTKLPGGSMGGGTRIAATGFIDTVRDSDVSTISAAISAALAVAKGPYREWLLGAALL